MTGWTYIRSKVSCPRCGSDDVALIPEEQDGIACFNPQCDWGEIPALWEREHKKAEEQTLHDNELEQTDVQHDPPSTRSLLSCEWQDFEYHETQEDSSQKNPRRETEVAEGV